MGGLTPVLQTFSDEIPTPNTTLTSHANANEKGNWSELEDSTAAAATMMRVRLGGAATAGAQINILVDIGTGGSGSESVLIANIQAGSGQAITSTGGGMFECWFPVNIPAGTRIAGRCQDAVGGDTIACNIQLYSGSAPGAGIDTMGATTASSEGTEVTAGNNAFGNWIEIEDSTTAVYRAVLPSIQVGSNNFQSALHLMQVGVGAAASEAALGGHTYEMATLNSESWARCQIMPIVAHDPVPVGSRLAVRIFGGSAAEVFQVALHGVK